MNPKLDAFASRTNTYACVSLLEPAVRHFERHAVLQRLDLQERQVVCDFRAASGYLGRGILDTATGIHLISIEPSSSLAARITNPGQILNCALTAIDLPSATVDRVGCLAGLHHESQPLAPLREIHRILKPGGRVAIAELETNSPQANWLNGFVHDHTPEGHFGSFVQPGDLQVELERLGFQQVVEERLSVPWRFRSYVHLARFFRCLFGLYNVSDSEIIEATQEIFDIRARPIDDFIEINWSLIYCRGIK